MYLARIISKNLRRVQCAKKAGKYNLNVRRGNPILAAPVAFGPGEFRAGQKSFEFPYFLLGFMNSGGQIPVAVSQMLKMIAFDLIGLRL